MDLQTLKLVHNNSDKLSIHMYRTVHAC